jgi:hypothetical protein
VDISCPLQKVRPNCHDVSTLSVRCSITSRNRTIFLSDG